MKSAMRRRHERSGRPNFGEQNEGEVKFPRAEDEALQNSASNAHPRRVTDAGTQTGDARTLQGSRKRRQHGL